MDNRCFGVSAASAAAPSEGMSAIKTTARAPTATKPKCFRIRSFFLRWSGNARVGNDAPSLKFGKRCPETEQKGGSSLFLNKESSLTNRCVYSPFTNTLLQRGA